MKKTIVRALALCLLATLLPGTMTTAFAATKQPRINIEGKTPYVGRGETIISVADMPEGAKLKSISSSDTEVLTVGKHDGFIGFGGLWMKPLKAGESKVTIRYACKGKAMARPVTQVSNESQQYIFRRHSRIVTEK